jgi:hypothetical protein
MLQLKVSTFLMPSQTPTKVLKLESLKFAECLYTYLRGAYYPDFYFQQFFTAVKSNVSFSSYSLDLKRPSLAISTNRSFSFNLSITIVCQVLTIATTFSVKIMMIATSLSSKSSGRNCSVIFRYKSIRYVWHTGDDKM